MEKRALGRTGMEIAPLIFGGNVFGWTVDRRTGFDLLDAFVDAGFDAIDTADYYSRWLPGHQGGESETMIGEWLAADPSRRDRVKIFTKVGLDMGGADRKGLSARWIVQAVEASLARLRTDRIDLYQSHRHDPSVPHEETLEAYRLLIEAGKVRAIGASNYTAQELAEALRVADAGGLPHYATLQPLYNLYDRDEYEGPLRDLTVAQGIAVTPYYSLASGFLTGKYRSQADVAGSTRQGVVKYLDAKGLRILAALDAVAARHEAQPAEVALAWSMARPGITAPIASATSRRQLDSLIRSASLTLTAADMAELTDAG